MSTIKIKLNSFRFVSSQDVKNFFMPSVSPRKDSQSSLLTKKDVNHLYKIQCKCICLFIAYHLHQYFLMLGKGIWILLVQLSMQKNQIFIIFA